MMMMICSELAWKLWAAADTLMDSATCFGSFMSACLISKDDWWLCKSADTLAELLGHEVDELALELLGGNQSWRSRVSSGGSGGRTVSADAWRKRGPFAITVLNLLSSSRTSRTFLSMSCTLASMPTTLSVWSSKVVATRSMSAILAASLMKPCMSWTISCMLANGGVLLGGSPGLLLQSYWSSAMVKSLKMSNA